MSFNRSLILFSKQVNAIGQIRGFIMYSYFDGLPVLNVPEGFINLSEIDDLNIAKYFDLCVI